MARGSGRVTAEQVREFIEDLAVLPVRIAPPITPIEWRAVLALAEGHRLTAYDAAYLELVKPIGLTLATLDDDLRKAALAEGVPLVESTKAQTAFALDSPACGLQ